MTLVLGKCGLGRGRRELDGNCDGEEVFEMLLYNPVSPPSFTVCVVVCILGEQVIIPAVC